MIDRDRRMKPVDHIKDWLVEYKSLSDQQVGCFAELQKSNLELCNALHDLFTCLSTDVQLLEPVCHQLFNFYRSSEDELKRFTLSLVPSLICHLLEIFTYKNSRMDVAVEACLLGIYNLEIVLANGDAKVSSFQIPSLAEPSIYHEPFKISTLALTEVTLSRFANAETATWTSGPFQHHEIITTQNRDAVFSVLLQCYNADLGDLNGWSLDTFCRTCFRIAGSGFTFFDSHESVSALKCPDNRGWRRLTVSPGFLVEMLSGIYFCMYNGHMKIAQLALEAIHRRACYELYADVQLVTNAIKNSLVTGASDTMGLAISVLPTASSSSMCKAALTNASFRAQKLPDDISIPDTATQSTLSSIDELSQTSSARADQPNSAGKSKATKMAHRLIKGDKSRVQETKLNSSSSSVGADRVDGLSVVVSGKKAAKTTVDVIELAALNSNPHHDESDVDEETIEPKPRSSSLTMSSPLHRQMVSRYSSHAINPSSPYTEL